MIIFITFKLIFKITIPFLFEYKSIKKETIFSDLAE